MPPSTSPPTASTSTRKWREKCKKNLVRCLFQHKLQIVGRKMSMILIKPSLNNRLHCQRLQNFTQLLFFQHFHRHPAQRPQVPVRGGRARLCQRLPTDRGRAFASVRRRVPHAGHVVVASERTARRRRSHGRQVSGFGFGHVFFSFRSHP